METPRLQGVNRELFREPEQPARQLPELVKKALEAFESRLQNEDFKPTLAEYLKLLQVEKEISEESEGAREITVTWVDPEPDYSEE